MWPCEATVIDRGGICMSTVLSEIAPQPAPSSSVRDFIGKKPHLLINGEWVEARSGKTLAGFDPATGREIGRVAEAGSEDVDRAVAAARAALESGPWPEMLPVAREALLGKLADLTEQ